MPKLRLFHVISIIFIFFLQIYSQNTQWDGPHPEIANSLKNIARHFEKYDVVLEPEKNEPDWWTGAPSVVRDEKGDFWLACRMRTAEGTRGFRGYEIRILKSSDGVHFEQYHTIKREEVPIPGFERPALLIESLVYCKIR